MLRHVNGLPISASNGETEIVSLTTREIIRRLVNIVVMDQNQLPKIFILGSITSIELGEED